MKLRTIIAALGISLAAGIASASTVSVTVGGQTYDVGIYFGAFSSNEAELTSQVFWGNQSLASQFAAAYGSSDDALNFDNGLYFAYGASRTAANVCAEGNSRGLDCRFVPIRTVERSYAVATLAAVPLPAALPLLLAALGGLGMVRRRATRLAA